MMPTSRPATDRARLPRHGCIAQGFTLIELMVVLAIMSILAVTASAYIGKRPAGIVRADAVARLSAAIEQSADTAKQTGTAIVFYPATVFPGISLTPTISRLDDQTAGARLHFYPDGSSNGGVLAVGGRPVLVLDWLTGEVRRATP